AINLAPFEIEVSDVMSGELARFKLEISDLETVLQELEFTIPIGEINEESPTFSEYGYFAIESTDTGYFTAPEYNWIEIDPAYGGPGTLVTAGHSTVDGYTQTIDLPFYFSYFGEVYDKISICSNGWISMGETELVFSRNRNIPSGSGPRAMIAPFWDDLCNGDIYSYNDFNNHYLVIEWSDFRNMYNYSFEIFEVILYDPEFYPTPTGDGDILFQYKDIHNCDNEENYATVGIENKGQTDGLLITFANIYPQTVHTLQNETAILFSTQIEQLVYLDEQILQTPTTSLSQNYPNPFNPETKIVFSLPEDGEVKLEIYNIKGQKVKTLMDCYTSHGDYELIWDGRDDNRKRVSSGVYFYQLKTKDIEFTKKMLLLK
ncbi:MAG: T9SS type A sorting domain-containing protein, partial [Candidatus Cloacimonetes bacterium]|nr:T9SS type A sorting domain-containing protein [Candidatus Cloacimonadota bacterium]